MLGLEGLDDIDDSAIELILPFKLFNGPGWIRTIRTNGLKNADFRE